MAQAERSRAFARRREVSFVPAAFAHIDERARDRAHLRMQEGAGAHDDAHLIAIAHHIEVIESLDRRFGLAFDVAKGREIVPPDKLPRRRRHGGVIEPARHPPGAARDRARDRGGG